MNPLKQKNPPVCYEDKSHFTKLVAESHTYFINGNRHFPNM